MILLRHLHCFASVAAVLACGFATEGGATTVVRFPFDSLCVRAETIAHVQVVDKQSFRDERRGEIVTRTVFKVLRSVKGGAAQEIAITLPGGRVEGQRLRVPGMPEFTPQQEAVLFLTGSAGRGSPWPVGLGQGCYDVLAGDQGRQVVLQANVTPIPNGPLFKPSSHRPFRVSLDDFLAQVNAVLSSSDSQTVDPKSPR